MSKTKHGHYSDDDNSKEICPSHKSYPVITATKLFKKGNIVLNERKSGQLDFSLQLHK